MKGYNMGFFSSIINAGSNAFNAYHQFLNQKKLQKYAYNLTQQGYRETPSAQRVGLENAGYNPILAVSNGVSFGGNFTPGSAAVATGNPADDIDGNIQNAYRLAKLEKPKNKAEIDNIKAGTNSANASASLAQEQAKTEQYRQKEMESQTFLNNVNTELARKDLSWRDKEYLMRIKTGYLNAQANHIASESAQLNAHTAQADYRLRKGITDYENVQRKAVSDFYKKHPIQKKITTGLGEWTGAIGNIFRGSVSKSVK